VGGLWETISGDALSQQSLSAALAASAFATVAIVWGIWSRRNVARLQRIPLRVLITGTRGKSSTVRLAHAALAAGGIPTLGKMTGTASRELDTAGAEHVTPRVGQVSILEMLETVHRSFLRDAVAPEAIVLECMAVTPDLISLCTEDIVRPQVSVVTNALWDHLEEQGTTLNAIAVSLSRAMAGADIAITAEHRVDVLATLGYEAHRRGCVFDAVFGSAVPAEILARLPTAHPDNVAIALAVAAYAGVDTETAVRGMESATSEPVATLPVTAEIDGVEWWYRDIGSVNDTDSLTPALDSAKAQLPPDTVTLGILTTRWDRPLRAIQFAASITPGDVDGLVIVGEPDLIVRHYARRAGWPRDRIMRVGTWGFGERPLYHRLRDFATSLTGISPTRIGLIGLENNHQYVADHIRGRMLGGHAL
jgi:poly-gamma-glutamate synthase PgsB/CapB